MIILLTGTGEEEGGTVAAEQLHNVLLVILCIYYFHTLYGAHYYCPIPVQLDFSVGGVSPPLELSVIDGRIIFCFATLGTLLSLL